jgi:hypothetical protein
MKGYVIKNEETKAIKKAAKKFGTLTVKTANIDGVIEINNYRKYPYTQEVDITFKGKIHASLGMDTSWFGYGEIQEKFSRVSKIKLTRYLKRITFESVKERMGFFGVNLSYKTDIKSVKWVS